MKKDREKRYDILFDDDELREALCSIGVFLADYHTGRDIPSRLWLELDNATEDTDQKLGWIAHLHPDDRQRVRRSMKLLLAGKSHEFEEVFRFPRKDGSYRWVVSRGHSINDGNEKPRMFIGVDIDVSTMKSVEQQLQRQNEQLETLRQVATVIGASLDLQETVQRILEQTQRIIPYDTATVQLLEDGYLRVIGAFGFRNINEVVRLKFPYPEAGSLSTAAIDTRRPWRSDDVETDFPAFVQPLPEDPIHSWLGIPLVRHDEVIGLLAADSKAKGSYTEEHLELAATIADHIAIALENARLHDETYQMAMSDALTGTGSRRRFQVEGRLLYETAQRNNRSVGIAMIDIDHFKNVNDQHGHAVGDKILRRVAEATDVQLRGSDLLARYGGEEFVILLPDADCKEAGTVARRVCRSVKAITHPEVNHPVTVSIGVACEIPKENSVGLDKLVQRADRALYRAKENGRNRVVIDKYARP